MRFSRETWQETDKEIMRAVKKMVISCFFFSVNQELAWCICMIMFAVEDNVMCNYYELEGS